MKAGHWATIAVEKRRRGTPRRCADRVTAMHRILHTDRQWPLHGASASRAIEHEALREVEAHALMRRAGHCVARLALAIAPHAQRVWVAAGPGNNGGDGLEAALHLKAAGRDVQVSLTGEPSAYRGDALDALQRARDAGVKLHPHLYTTTPVVDLAIDALLGLGADRPAVGELARAMALLNEVRAPRLAVDLPSGLNADAGQPRGTACVRATHTLSLLTLKPGLFTAAGRDLAGDIWFDPLGVETPPQHSPDAWLVGADEARAWTPRRLHAQHKGSFGDVIVIGGDSGMAGAAVLAARAALTAGAGRVYLSLLDAAPAGLDAGRPELMLRPRLWEASPGRLGASTVVCGCGAGDAVRTALPALLHHAARLVLDADALNAIAVDPGLQAMLRSRHGRGLPTVLTPHPLEAARLLRTDTADVQADRVNRANRLAADLAAVVLLKGSGTVIAAPGHVPYLNPTGNPALATPGTGDVLAGWIGGVWAGWATASAGACTSDALHAVVTSVWRHGAAADACANAPLRAADLIEAMWRVGVERG